MTKGKSTAITGGCLCGAVRYEITADPLFSGKCYCTDCRRSSSTGHSAIMAVPAPALKVTGKLTGYSKGADSGMQTTRRFCPTCGSGIYTTPEAMAGVAFVKASTLDDPEQFPGGHSIYVSRAPTWDQPQPGSVTFAEMPPPNTDMS
jgi:hypothetical protein